MSTTFENFEKEKLLLAKFDAEQRIFQKLNISFDLDELDEGLKIALPLFDHRNQICVTTEPGVETPLYHNSGTIYGTEEPVCSEINPEFKGSIFEKILKSIGNPHTRARIMRLTGKSCYTMHWDMTPRFHVVLETQPTSYFLFQKFPPVHIPKDGHLYWVDARRPHTALNCSKLPRYHFVIVDPYSKKLPIGGFV